MRQDISAADLRARAILVRKGHGFEDMLEGREFSHHWGRTLTAGDNADFTTRTLSFCPLYFNQPYARSLGHADLQVNPLLVFTTVYGLSVEDLSEAGGQLLAIDDCEFLHPVHVGDTLTARSRVERARASDDQPEFGIVTWHTEGYNQEGYKVISFSHTSLVPRREGDRGPARPGPAPTGTAT